MMLLAEQRILKLVEKGRRAGRCLKTFRAAENVRMPVEGGRAELGLQAAASPVSRVELFVW